MPKETEQLKEDLLQYANAFFNLIGDKTNIDLIADGYTNSEAEYLIELKANAVDLIKNNTL